MYSKVIASAKQLLSTGDPSGVELKPCLYIQDPTFYQSYSWRHLLHQWATNAHNWTIPSCRLQDIMTSIHQKSFYITYADRCCNESFSKALKAAHDPGGFDVVIGYRKEVMKDAFREKYKDILERPRGAGYWLWKPYVILKTLVEDMDWGDYLCYVDADSHSITDVGPIGEFSPQGQYAAQCLLVDHMNHAIIHPVYTAHLTPAIFHALVLRPGYCVCSGGVLQWTLP